MRQDGARVLYDPFVSPRMRIEMILSVLIKDGRIAQTAPDEAVRTGSAGMVVNEIEPLIARETKLLLMCSLDVHLKLIGVEIVTTRITKDVVWTDVFVIIVVVLEIIATGEAVFHPLRTRPRVMFIQFMVCPHKRASMASQRRRIEFH